MSMTPPKPVKLDRLAPKTISIVDEALAIVRGNREQCYGPPDQNFRTIAAFWSSWLSTRLRADVTLDGADVCYLMQLVKLARLANSPRHRDSIVDIVGYADCVDVVRNHEATK